ncbi:glycosyltransferase [Agromyces archimandritae]|uniref:Glycosyltransferase n=1 Tax=Agromyces archimandritae TaxID=2781962 RepID=A0A975FN04_9MICO|nr:glycosyltransferase [Agromyces archimandritae]QTX05430.1 glycosyltransferase [Agromyces archimandritae]
MRVLHVIRGVARLDGGPSETIRGLLPALRRLGIDARLATTDTGLDRHADADILAWPGAVFASSSGRSPLERLRNSSRILRSEVEAADLVHVHGTHTVHGSLGLAHAHRRNRPVILQPHGSLGAYQLARHAWRKHAYRATVDRTALSAARHVIASSERERDDILQALPDSTVHLVPLGVDPSLFELPIAPRREPLMCFVGRIAAKKRVDLLLGALAELSPPTRLVIAGTVSGDQRVDLAGLAARLGIQDRVEFIGPVDAAGRARLLGRSSVFVLPSEDESFGVAAAEAMAAGCAVAVTSEVGLAASAASAGAVATIDPMSSAIAEAILPLLNDESARLAVAERGRAYAREHFAWDLAARRTLASYLATLSGAPA